MKINLETINACVLVPTYNNDRTLKRILDELLTVIPEKRLIVVNDGSTDATAVILAEYSDRIHVLKNTRNSGKGTSLRKGFTYAHTQGFSYAITIDSDGQHYPSDLGVIVEAVEAHPGAVIMGSRNMEQEGVPGKSSFGNKFSNFWFKVETWISLPDTQTGFRAYPLQPISKLRLFTRKFELEIEVIVRLAWRGVAFFPVPIRVKYDPEERVSHFRPARDFFRISVLNTVLFLLAILYYYPKRLLSKDTLLKIKQEAIKPEETNLRKAISLAFGVFWGIFPIWGFQLMIGIPIAVFFRLNKVLFITAANISIPPMIPFIIAGSLAIGQWVYGEEIQLGVLSQLSLESIKENVMHYYVGAVVFATLMGVVTFGISYALLSLFRKQGE